MKALKITIIIGLLLFVVTQASAQIPKPVPVFKSGEFGVRYMPSYSSFDLRTAEGAIHKGEFIIGHGFGVLLAINSKHVGLQLEVIYNSIAQKYKDKDLDRKIHLNYVNIPLLITLNTDKTKPVNLSFVVGPQLGINVGSKVETNGGNSNNNGTYSTYSTYRNGSSGTDTLQAVLAVKKSDVGIAYGAGLEFALNPARSVRLGVGFRGVFGLVDISDKSSTTTTNEYYIIDRTNMETYAGYVGLSFLF